MKFINWQDIEYKGVAKGNKKTTCPLCSHDRKKKSDPCLSVNFDKGVAKCWNCDGISFRDKKEDVFELPKQDWQNHTKLSDKLVYCYEKSSHDGWHWFEPYLTYSNGKLAEALFYSYIVTREPKYLEIATLGLNFLITKTFNNGRFVPIGQKGWHQEEGKRSYHDQQPIEAASMILTLSTAYKVLRNPLYLKYSFNAFQWFLGNLEKIS